MNTGSRFPHHFVVKSPITQRPDPTPRFRRLTIDVSIVFPPGSLFGQMRLENYEKSTKSKFIKYFSFFWEHSVSTSKYQKYLEIVAVLF